MRALKRAILMTVGSEGNVGPFVSIGTELASRGIEVYLLTHARFSRRFANSPIQFVSVDSDAEYEGFLREGERLNRRNGIAGFFRRYFLGQATREIASVLGLARPEETVLAVSEMPGISARIASELSGIPMVSIYPNPGFLSTRHLFEQLLSIQLATDVERIRQSYGLAPCDCWEKWWRSETAAVALWPKWFGETELHVDHAGFVWMDDVVEDLQYNDEVWIKDFILVTGGTGFFASRAFFETSLEACRILGRKSLVVCQFRDLLPASLFPNVKYMERVANLASLMFRTSMVINHGGMGTVAQAIAAGRPQVILAAGGDRPEVARMAEKAGVGRAIVKAGWKAERVAAVMEQVLSDDHIKTKCQELAPQAGHRGNQEACDIIVSAFQTGKRHHRTSFRGEEEPNYAAAEGQ